MSSMLSSWGWRAEASARNKIKMEWLPSIWNWSEVEISSFVSLGFRNRIPRFRGSLDRDVDSIDDSWKYCSKFYSKIYIIEPTKSAVHSRATNHSAGHDREANHSACDFLFLPGVIIYEQNKSLAKLTVAPSSQCSNLCDGVIWLSHSTSYNFHMWKTLRRKNSVKKSVMAAIRAAAVISTRVIFCIKIRAYLRAKWKLLQSNQVKRTPQEPINEFIIQKLNPLLVVDFRLISAFLYV